jgi:hypothetical protein
VPTLRDAKLGLADDTGNPDALGAQIAVPFRPVGSR